jgi:hypothetical protein
MFYIEAMPAPVIVKENIVRLGLHICEQLNSIPDNTALTTVEENLFFWPHDNAVCWNEIIGTDAALAALEKKAGVASDEGFYARYKNLIDAYFHPGTYSSDLADVLLIPDNLRFELLHPTYHEQHDQSSG